MPVHICNPPSMPERVAVRPDWAMGHERTGTVDHNPMQTTQCTRKREWCMVDGGWWIVVVVVGRGARRTLQTHGSHGGCLAGLRRPHWPLSCSNPVPH